MYLLLLLVLALTVLLPLFYIGRLFRLDDPSFSHWLLSLLEAAVVLALIMLVGRWDIAGFYTFYALALLLALAAMVSFLRHVRRPWRAEASPPLWKARPVALITIAAFAGVLVWIGSGLVSGPTPRALAFPLEGGPFIVGQGGNHSLLNHHHGHREQRHAADIVALGPAGFRASGLLPEEVTGYAIFGARVVSPCAGRVVVVRDGVPDLVPPRMDPENPPGNHVIIACDGLRIMLAHLKQGSITVVEGERLAEGDFIGCVGNSGNTSEPHLHVHAYNAETGEGVQVAFDGAVPIRNRIYSRPSAAP